LNQGGARSRAVFLGVYEHRYAENTFAEPGFGTHYIVLAYEVELPDKTRKLPDSQHTLYTWMLPADILHAENVHPNTRAYFTPASKT
jgi:colanic acid biosynthesis protein WcaH